MTRTDTDILKEYLTRLATRAAADGKFVGMGDDRARAVARALLSGAGGMLGALLEDVKRVAGDGRIAATSAVAGLATRAVERGIRVGMDKLAEAVVGSFDKEKRARKIAGRAIMKAAKEMGR